MKKSEKSHQQTPDRTDVHSTTSSPDYDGEDNGNRIDSNTERQIELVNNFADYILYQD